MSIEREIGQDERACAKVAGQRCGSGKFVDPRHRCGLPTETEMRSYGLTIRTAWRCDCGRQFEWGCSLADRAAHWIEWSS